MERILALWAVPRSTSTAFERMMRQRGDFECLHEPFGEAWYFGDEWRCPPQRHIENRPGVTYRSTHEEILALAGVRPVFLKDFGHYITHMADDAFLDAYEHSFLIRDPADVLPSMWSNWPDFVIEEAGYAEQHLLFDRVAARTGRIPPVIDAADLLDDPHGVTVVWCEAICIPFMGDALEWGTSDRAEHSWWEGGSWHGKLERSTGFVRQERDYVAVDHNEHLRSTHALCRPHYEALRSHRLTP